LPALALVVQAFAVFTPPESANAANGNNIIYGGFKNKEELLTIYDRNRDSAGHKDIQQIYSYFGITRQDLINAKWTTFNSRDFNLTINSVGRSTYSWQRTPHKIPNSSTTVYASLLYKFDSTEWTKKHGSMYSAVVGKRAVDGKWFAIMSACGNPAYITLPPPPPQPSAECSGLVIAPITRTKFTFTTKASVKNGATITGYTYTIKDTNGTTVLTKTQPSSGTSDALTHELQNDGNYTVSATVNTSIGPKTGPNCQKAFSVTPEPRCPLNPDLVASDRDCKPCEADSSIWYKDENCRSDFELTKTVRNTSQLVMDANNTTVKPGDRLEYRLSVKNTGSTTGSYTIEDNLADVLEYADIIDTGGGNLIKKDSNTPIEDVNHISWPTVEIKPGESIEKIISVQVKSVIPSTPQSPGNIESYNCRMVNDFDGQQTSVNVECPPPKVVEEVVTELPKTGTTENMIFAGSVLAIVTYFYARSRQLKKEVRLIRRDLNTGTI